MHPAPTFIQAAHPHDLSRFVLFDVSNGQTHYYGIKSRLYEEVPGYPIADQERNAEGHLDALPAGSALYRQNVAGSGLFVKIGERV